MKRFAGRIESRTARAILGGLAIVLVALIGTAYAQSTKAAKDAENLQKSADAAKKSIQDSLDHVKKLITDYNGIVDGTVKKPEQAYSKLTNDTKATQKKLQAADKSVTAMNKQADKFFADWEKDLSSFSNDTMKAKSQSRLDSSKQRYGSMGEALTQAGAAFEPLLVNLNDQILFLGRDLSPEAIADLKPEADALNSQADEVFAQVEAILSGEAAEAPDMAADEEPAGEGEEPPAEDEKPATEDEEPAEEEPAEGEGS